MRKILRYAMLVAAAAAASSCAKEIAQESTPENSNLTEITINASVGTEDTKAGFAEDSYQIEWAASDAISVLGTATGNQSFTANSAGKGTTFTGLADLSDETLYAVYPYDAAITLTESGLEKVSVPAVQTATAGTFDPKAFVAAATSTDKENFEFKTIGAFVKFRLEDATNVKSVTLMANEYVENNETKHVSLAGTAAVTFNASGIPTHGGTWVSGTASSSVKLVEGDEGFTSGTDYHFVIRAHACNGGITLYVEYDNGTVKSIASTKALSDNGVRNKVINLGEIKESSLTEVNDLYVLYTLGQDINFGSTTFNIADGNALPAKTVNATTADTDVRAYCIGENNSAIVFLSQDNGANFTFSNYGNLNSTICLISRYTDAPVTIKSNGSYLSAKGGAFYAKNINLDMSGNTSKQYFIYNYNVTSNTDAIVFDGCKVSGIAGNLLAFTGSGITNLLEIVNSDLGFTTTATTTTAVLINANQKSTFPKVNIKNNVIYCNNTDGRLVNIFGSTNNNPSIADLNLEKNTLVNVYPDDYYVRISTANTVNIKNNYFYLPELGATNNAGSSYTGLLYATTYPTANSSIATNFCYRKGTSTYTDVKTFKAVQNSTKLEWADNPYNKDSSDTGYVELTIDWNDLTFVSNNNSYGAQR